MLTKIRSLQNIHLRRHIVLLFLVIVVGLMWLVQISTRSSWWQIPSRGEVHLSPIVTYKKISWVTNLGEVYAADKKTGAIRWRSQLSSRDPYSFTSFQNYLILLMPQGVLTVLSADTGRELWTFYADNEMNFSGDYHLKNGALFVSSADASVYAVDLRTGRLQWRFQSKTTALSGSHDVDRRANLYGKLEYCNGHLLYASPDAHLYKLSPQTGRVEWETEIGGAPSAMQLQDNVLYVGLLDGRIVGVHFKDGIRLFENNSNTQEVMCFRDISLAQGWETWPTLRAIKHALNYPLLAATKDGSILAYSAKLDASEVIANLNAKLFSCPQLKHNQGYVFVNDGTAYHIMIHQKALTTLFNTGVHNNFAPLVINNEIISTSYGGGLSNFNSADGQLRWSYNSMGQIVSQPVIDGKYLYFTDTDGRLSKIETDNGRIPVISHIPKVKVTQEVKDLTNSKFYEFTLFFDEAKSPNPWSQIKIEAQFNHQALDKPIVVDGYYYDTNTWKVRFNPPFKGDWTWNITFMLPNGEKTSSSGAFTSETDASTAYLRANKEYPQKFTVDGVHEFFPIGIQECVNDSNNNGSVLDDWHLSESSSQSATFTSLDRYLSEYGHSGNRFNMFRFGVNNCTFGLFDNLYVGAQPAIQNAKALDNFFYSLRQHSFRLWMSLFSFYINEHPYAIEKEFLEEYVRYIVARYGVFVDIWEIGNETHSSNELISHYAQLIRSLDYEQRLITTSWEMPDNSDIDIVSLHDYASDPSWRADTALLNFVKPTWRSNKPTVMSEIGNRDSSWDVDSLQRMRVRSWTGFFNNISLIYWNISWSKSYYSKSAQNGNLYIGPEERSQIEVLNSFTKDVPLNASRIPLTTTDPGFVRGYGIETKDRLLGYFVCEYPHKSFGVSHLMTRNGVAEWIDPETGAVILSTRLARGTRLLHSPFCRLDLAVKIRFID